MSAAGALNSLGSDLAFSVSFSIATQLLDAANEQSLSEEELVGVVLAVSIILGAIPSGFKAVRKEIRSVFGQKKAVSQSSPPGSTSMPESAQSPPPRVGGLMEFASLLVSMAQRISLSICVQLLSSNVTARQPLRSVRIVSLLGVSIFFLFLESTSHVRNR
tara:strand:- start:58 stop:540 length:483 start_codon:yes stop_codon:yes gene_type:complete